MVLDLIEAGVGVAATAVLAAAAIYGQALTLSAGVIAAVFGSVIVVVSGFPFLVLLVLFVVGSSLATRYGFEEKKRRSVQEGTHGERGVSNVLAHILLPTGLVLTSIASPRLVPAPALAILYTSALAFGAADTFASEFGVLSGRARSILSGKVVTPGTNGGVSALGEFWAFLGAFSTAVIAVLVFSLFGMPQANPVVLLVVSASTGFAACQVDSVLGETLENRGLLTKGSTNFFAMLSAIVIAAAILVGLSLR